MRCLLVLLLFAMNVVAVERKAANVSKRTQALFEWFDRLDLPDVSGAKFVHIWTGGSVLIDDAKVPDVEVIDGFLLADDGPTFRVVLRDMTISTFTKSDAPSEHTGYREIAIDEEANELLAELGIALRAPHDLALDVAREARDLAENRLANYQDSRHLSASDTEGLDRSRRARRRHV